MTARPMEELVEKMMRGIALADEQNGGPCYEVRIANKHTRDVLRSEAVAALAVVLDHYSHEKNAPTHNRSRDWSWCFAQNFALAVQDELERMKHGECV